ncbi:MAG: GNAT family N-acetyltransferase [Planctomycetota bacterium]
MGQPTDDPYRIRPYRRSDRQAVRGICVATCWMGDYRPEMIPDEWLWAEYWTRYFTDRDPGLSWVAVQAGRTGNVVGYLTGTADIRRFEAYAPYLLAPMAARAIRRRLISRSRPRRALLAFARSALRGELAIPPALLRDYPATWHFNLLPAARRQGLGSRMLSLFIAHLRKMNVPGLHAQVISTNAASIATCRRMGMQLRHASALTAYRHIDPSPMQLQTWAMRLRAWS